MRSELLGLACLVIAVPTASFAQDTRNAELATANIELNATYVQVMRNMTAENKAALKTAQRAWIAFRDADCVFAYTDRRDCLIARTDERVEQLKGMIE